MFGDIPKLFRRPIIFPGREIFFVHPHFPLVFHYLLKIIYYTSCIIFFIKISFKEKITFLRLVSIHNKVVASLYAIKQCVCVRGFKMPILTGEARIIGFI